MRIALTATVVLVALLAPAGARSSIAQGVTTPTTITIHVPEPRTFELALDEVELDWSEREPNRPPTGAPTVIAGTQLRVAERTRAVLSLTSVTSVAALVARRGALEAANPGAEALLVVYEPGARRASTRQLLTARAALVLDDPADPTGALVEYAARNPQPIPGMPGAFVLQASDPLSAIDLANALRLRPGVQVAYPLMKRQLATR